MRRWRGKCDDWARNRGLQPAFSGFSVTQKARAQLSQFLPAFRHSYETSNTHMSSIGCRCECDSIRSHLVGAP
jgi:hypothetical protein